MCTIGIAVYANLWIKIDCSGFTTIQETKQAMKKRFWTLAMWKNVVPATFYQRESIKLQERQRKQEKLRSFSSKTKSSKLSKERMKLLRLLPSKAFEASLRPLFIFIACISSKLKSGSSITTRLSHVRIRTKDSVRESLIWRFIVHRKFPNVLGNFAWQRSSAAKLKASDHCRDFP